MARMSGATWRPVANFTKGGQDAVYGVVIHIMDGTLNGSEAWFDNPAAQASSHFGTGKDGQLRQWVDTKDRAWAQAGGNHTWLSVENEGRGGDSLTDAQINRCAQVLAWAHTTHGVPLQLTTSTTGRGLGYHGMGGSAWGGHTSCPGTKIVAQLPEILKRAKVLAGIVTAPSKPSTKPTVDLSNVIAAARRDPGLKQGGTTHPTDVKLVEAALKAEGLLSAAYASDGSFGSTTVAAYRKWQLRCGYSGSAADGIPGLASLTKLGAKRGFKVKG
jgi:hypothetical protein